MFGKREAEITVVGAGAVVEGTVKAKGSIQIDGTILGTLRAEGHVSIGPDGSVDGEVHGENIAIGGNVKGKVSAKGHLHVISSGVVQGELQYSSLEVDRGAVVDARTTHVGAPSEIRAHGEADYEAEDEAAGARPLTVVS